jgi:hypothetical protein
VKSFLFVCFSACGAIYAQAQAQFVGTVKAVNTSAAEVLIQPDKGDAITLRDSGSTALRVAPGERDLKNASPIRIEEIASGDRVLVTVEPGTRDIRRIVVMPSKDIARRDEANRTDWEQRGMSGVVRSAQDGVITVTVKGVNGEQSVPVVVTQKTILRRWGPEATRFEDAKAGSIREIRPGDQIRARGDRGPDGSSLIAEEVVSGAFQTRVGSVTSIDSDSGLIRLKDQRSGSEITVKLPSGSQIRMMASFGSGGPGGAPGAPGPMPSGPAPQNGPPPGPGPDINQIVERLPLGEIGDIKPGQTVIVSGTKGANPDELTAITLVTNADMLIRMSAGPPRRPPSGGTGGIDAPQNSSGFSGFGPGLDLSGILQ